MARTHTPGPWQIGEQDWVVETDAGVEVAQAATANPNWRANAWLIAAAPDLLAALVACESQLTREWSDRSEPAILAARAAIIRARGGCP